MMFPPPLPPRSVSAPQRVCLIGNSFVGAVLRAYEDASLREGFAFSFFSSAGHMYERIAFSDSQITGVQFHNGGDTDMREYDQFVIYGGMIAPPDWITMERGLRERGAYSEQARAASLRDWISGMRAGLLWHGLRQITDKPIYLVSRNIPLGELPRGTARDYAAAAAQIEAAITPARYIQQPEGLLNADRTSNPAFFHGSLDVTGREPDRASMPNHDKFHYNVAGGTLVLREIIARLRHDRAAAPVR